MKQRLLFREHRILIRHFRTIYTCSLAVGGEDNRVEPAVVGGQEVRAGLRHFRLEATGHGNLVEERSTFGGHQGECKYDERWKGNHETPTPPSRGWSHPWLAVPLPRLVNRSHSLLNRWNISPSPPEIYTCRGKKKVGIELESRTWL